MKDKIYQSVIVLHKDKHCVIDIYIHYIEWEIARLIWIAFYKEENNDKCLIANLPKDLIKYILNLLGRIIYEPEIAARNYIKL